MEPGTTRMSGWQLTRTPAVHPDGTVDLTDNIDIIGTADQPQLFVVDMASPREAALATAAPELLAALKEACDVVYDTSAWRRLIARIEDGR